MKKSKTQKKILVKNRMIPFLWIIINDQKERLTVMNWLTGTFRVLDK